MIDPSNLILIDDLGGENRTSVIDINHLPEFDQEEFDIYDDKDYKKYIAEVEKVVRQSPEYKWMIEYLRNYMDMDKCAFFQNVTNAERSKMRIEIHHSPFTLYDIVVTVIQKRIYYKEDMDVEMVAREVMILHYKLMVGLIPLSRTPHELVHSQYLFVPLQNVMGRYDLFIDYYKEFMPPELLDTYERIESYSKVYGDGFMDKTPLLQNNIYVDASNCYNLPNFQSLQIAMKNRVQEIKDNHYILPSLEDNQIKNKNIIPFEFVYGDDYICDVI